MVFRSVIVLGGPQDGTRFRTISLDIHKALFPICGVPMIEHQIQRMAALSCIDRIYLVGSFSKDDMTLRAFVQDMSAKYRKTVLYLQESTSEIYGTAGCLLQLRSQITEGINEDDLEGLLVCHCDSILNFKFEQLFSAYESLKCKDGKNKSFIGVFDVKRHLTKRYGVVTFEPTSMKVISFLEGVHEHQSSHINCGVYLLQPDIYQYIQKRTSSLSDKRFHINHGLLDDLILEDSLYAYEFKEYFVHVKNPGCGIVAAQMINSQRKVDGVYLSDGCKIASNAVIGPNVTLGKNCVIASGVKISDSIILDGCHIGKNTLVKFSVIGRNSKIGDWCRIEGSKLVYDYSKTLMLFKDTFFDKQGRLLELASILGSEVTIKNTGYIFNSIILSNRVEKNCSNKIII